MERAMQDLIERLEKATGPDRELDTEIFRAVHWNGDPDSWPYCLRYTSSIDAALTMVPDGSEWCVERRHSKAMAQAYASIWSPGARDVDFHANAAGKTPAIALCIAALKARLAMAQLRQME